MGYCTNCGNELKDGAQFCPKCGSPVISMESKIDSSEDSSGYSIELMSFEPGMRPLLTSVLTDLLRIELMDAVKTIDSAPCSIAKGLSRWEADKFAERMVNAGAAIVMKYNGELVSRMGNQQFVELDKEDDLGCVASAFSFLIPVVGFLIFAYNWREKPRIAESALLAGIWGSILSMIIAICIWGSILFHS